MVLNVKLLLFAMLRQKHILGASKVQMRIRGVFLPLLEMGSASCRFV